jgi:DNA-binding transcriptional ArsR family regulator
MIYASRYKSASPVILMHIVSDVIAASHLVQALADPVRLAILQRLLEGPAAVAELTAVTGSGQSNVSNHLAVLREAGAVTGRRRGRQTFYRLDNAAVAQVVESLLAASGPSGDQPSQEAPLAVARTCYDHIAGALGVALLDSLIKRDAVGEPRKPRGDVDLGKHGVDVFEQLGVDLSEAARARRRFAFACLDWTERRPHLGGALGAVIARRFLEMKWVESHKGTRAVLLTIDGRRSLRRLLDLRLG